MRMGSVAAQLPACRPPTCRRCPPPLPSHRQLAYRNGATAAQYKPPVLVSKPEQWQLLEAAVVAAAAATQA